MTDQAEREFRMMRKHGASSAARERLAAANAAATDWHTTCQNCGAMRYGTLEQLKKPCEVCSVA